MSAGEATARKPANSRDSAIAAMRATLSEFRRQSTGWERDVERLFDDVETLAVTTALEQTLNREPSPAGNNEQFSELVDQQRVLHQLQQSTATELAQIRKMLEGHPPVDPQSQIKDLAVKQQAMISQLRDSLIGELATLRESLTARATEVAGRTELSVALPSRLEEMHEATSKELNRLRESLEKSTRDAQLGVLADRQQKQLTDLQSAITAEMAKWRQALEASQSQRGAPENAVEERLVTMQEMAAAEFLELRKLLESSESTDEIHRLVQHHQEQLSELRKALTSELASLRPMLEASNSDQATAELAQLESRLELLQKMSAAEFLELRKLVEKSDTSDRFNRLAQHHQDQLAELRMSVASELASLRPMLEASKSDQDTTELAGLENRLEQLQRLSTAEFGRLSKLLEKPKTDSKLDEWVDRQQQQFTALQESIASELASLSQLLERARPADSPPGFIDVDGRLEALQEAVLAELRRVRELLEQPDNNHQLDSIASRQEQLSEIQQLVVDGLSEVSESLQKQQWKSLEERLVDWRSASSQEFSQLQEELSRCQQPSPMGEVVEQQQALFAELQQAVVAELVSLRELIAESQSGDSSAKISELEQQLATLSETTTSEFDRVRKLLEDSRHDNDLDDRLNAQQQRLADLHQLVSAELSQLRDTLEGLRPDEQSESLTGLVKTISELQVATSSQLTDLRKALNNPSQVTQIGAMVEGQHQQLSALEQRIEAELEKTRQFLDSWHSEGHGDAAAEVDDRLAKLQETSAAELARLRELMEKAGPGDELKELASQQQQQIANLKQSTETELATVRQLIEQQTDLLAAFVEAAERMTLPAQSAVRGGRKQDPVVDAVKSQFEQLQKSPTDPGRSR